MAERVTPTTQRRKLEAKTLLTCSVKYMEDTDNKMSEICTNVINFFKDFATKMDANREKLRQTEVNFQVSLASCGDRYDTLADNQEDELKKKVKQMTESIHHVQLNEKLQECFDILDQIQKTYRNYNTEYVELVQAHPQTMNTFFDQYEADLLSNFKIFKEEKRAEIEALLKDETEKKQAKLEAKALRKLEAEAKAEEAKRLAEEAKTGKPASKAPAKPPAKGGAKGKDDKPVLDVPQLDVPKPIPFCSEMGNKYIQERPLFEVVERMMKSAESPEESDKEEELAPAVSHPSASPSQPV